MFLQTIFSVAIPSLRLAVRLFSLPVGLLRSCLTHVLNALVALAVTFAALHRIGAIKRIIQWRTEVEIGKLANDALITVGDMEVSVVGGRVVATDLIVHASKRDEWMWDSPLIARIGRIDVRLNVLSCIDVVGPAMGFPCKDIHSVVAEDIQVFVEKRRNVFNFHLLDPSLDLPDASEVLESMGVKRGENGMAVATEERSGPGGADDDAADVEGGALIVKRAGDNNNRLHSPSHRHGGNHAASVAAEAKANEIVSGLVGAVSSVGRAATGAGANGESLVTALMNQKAGFVGQLRQFQARLEGSSKPQDWEMIPEEGQGTSGQRPAYTKKQSDLELLAKDGVKVIQQMGRVLGRNVTEMKEQVDTFQPPPKKEGWVDPAADERFRFGRIVLRDARIFTKDIIGGSSDRSHSSSAAGAAADGPVPSPSRSHTTAHTVTIAASGGKSSAPAAIAQAQQQRQHHQPSPSGWAEPIFIRELAVSAAELCPPMTAREDSNCGDGASSGVGSGLPELGLKIERVLDIVVARLLAETAKSNTGRLLNNAFGEVCTWMERKSGGVSGAGKHGSEAQSQRHMGSG